MRLLLLLLLLFLLRRRGIIAIVVGIIIIIIGSSIISIIVILIGREELKGLDVLEAHRLSRAESLALERHLCSATITIWRRDDNNKTK